MKHFPFWLKLSFLHPTVSVLLLSVAYLCPNPAPWGAVGYHTALLGFLLNLPGIGVLSAVLPPAPMRQIPDTMITGAMVFITWGCVVVPFCFGVSRLVRWLWRRRGKA